MTLNEQQYAIIIALLENEWVTSKKLCEVGWNADYTRQASNLLRVTICNLRKQNIEIKNNRVKKDDKPTGYSIPADAKPRLIERLNIAEIKSAA